MLDVYQAIQNGVTVEYGHLAPWVTRGLNVFLGEMRRARRLDEAHREVEIQLGFAKP